MLPEKHYPVGYIDLPHSRPQSPRSLWPAAGIESSGWFQTRTSVNHGLRALLRKLTSGIEATELMNANGRNTHGTEAK